VKILHVLDHSIPLHSGYTFRTRAILEQQRRLGFETFHLTGPKHASRMPVEEVDGLRFFRTTETSRSVLGRIPALRQAVVIRDLRRRLADVVDEVRPDLIHAHSPALNGVAAIRVGRETSLPVVYEVRAFWEDAAVDHGTSREGGPRYRLTRALETWVLRRAGAVTTICEGLRGDIVARGIAADRVTVIPNAVDVARFHVPEGRDPELEREFGLQGRPVAGFIGSFYAYEGLSLLLDALPALDELHLLLVGGGNEAEALRDQARRLGLSNRVHLTGRVPNDQVARYYSLCDVMVYPRLRMRLTDLVTPLKPLEAMALGRLVVASDVGGHKELIRPGETGLLFEAGDKDSLARTLRDLLAHPETWPGMLRAGRRFVEEERTWESSVGRYVPVFERLLARSR